MAFLCGAFGVQTQPGRLSRRFDPFPVFLHLGRRIEDDVICISEYLIEFVFPVSGRKDMGLPAEFLMPQSGLEKSAGCSSRQIFPEKGIDGEHGKCLLGQQDLTSGPPGNLPENLQVLF